MSSNNTDPNNDKNINAAARAALALSSSFSIILLSVGCFILMLSKSGCI
jgi:hypothetical protein